VTEKKMFGDEPVVRVGNGKKAKPRARKG